MIESSLLNVQLDEVVAGQAPTVEPRAPGTVLALFWWRDLALGQCRLTAEALPEGVQAWLEVAAPAVAEAIEHYLGEARPTGTDDLRERIIALADSPAAQQTPRGRNASVSVVVATRGRPESLARCLDSLLAADTSPAEIIVVESGIAEEPSATAAVCSDRAGVRYVSESRPGSSLARNLGAREATSPLIAFIDDDETAGLAWLSRLVAPFADPGIDVVTGLVVPLELLTPAQLLFEDRFSFIRGFTPRDFGSVFLEAEQRGGLPVWRIGGSGNMAVRRDVFLNLGGFDDRLGAGRAGCSEDSEFFYRVLANGGRCHYEPGAWTRHRHRGDLPSLKRQVHAYMRGHVTALLIQRARYGHKGNLKRLFVGLPLQYARYLLLGLGGHPACPLPTLAAELGGCVSGIGFYFRATTRN